MSLIPKTTQPLAKAIRTLEGQITVVASTLEGVLAAVDPSKLNPKWAAIAIAAQSVGLALSRGYAKAHATASPLVSEGDALLLAIEHGDPTAVTEAADAVAPAEIEHGLAPDNG